MTTRVLCNVCGVPLPGKDPTAFLCVDCSRFAPLPALLRYRRAVRDMQAFTRLSWQPATEAPPHLLDELAASWRLCADAARAAHAKQDTAA